MGLLGLGILSGAVLGLFSDIVFGKFLGLWSYTLGFDLPFLLVNAVLLYGLFAAHVLLMQRVRMLHFIAWVLASGVVFEVSNYYFPLWTYHFFDATYWTVPVMVPPVELLIVVSAGYVATAFTIATIAHVFLGHRFALIERYMNRKPIT